MGYTHYWTQTDTVTPDDWIDFADGCKRLFDLCKARRLPLRCWTGRSGKPAVTGAEVAFNGAGDNSHESMVITRQPDAERGGFCKTARKPYDLPVAAILIYLDSVLPDTFSVRSDGGLWNYRDALDLAREAWPHKANILDFPRELRLRSRFSRPLDDRHAGYQVVLGLDEVVYVEDEGFNLRRLPQTMQAYSEWSRDLPPTMRRWGSFSGGQYREYGANRLKAVWEASEPVASVVYDPQVHGLLHPEIRNAADGSPPFIDR